jgi:4-hydroxy-2-oxoheptanedioate aldolase
MEAMAEHNAQTLLIFQIETKEALASLDSILSIPGVDGVLVGPNDLSISLGVPGAITGDVMVNAFQTVLDKCLKHGVIPGCHINDTQLAAKWAAKGFRFVSSSADTMMIQVGAQMVSDTIKKACK